MLLSRRHLLRTVWVPFAASAHAADLRAGQILVATPASRDPDFRETVILLIHYDRRGGIGLMLNRPAKIAIADLLPRAANIQGYAWAGGPVPLGIVGLLRTRRPPSGATPIFGDVVLISDRDVVRDLARRAMAPSRFRVYAGNCGWTVAQLEDEMRRGLWTARPASPEIVFNTDPQELWSRLVK
jgi:putative transcriptional regulator